MLSPTFIVFTAVTQNVFYINKLPEIRDVNTQFKSENYSTNNTWLNYFII